MTLRQSSDATFEATVLWSEDRDVLMLSGEFDIVAALRVGAVIHALLARGRRRILINLDAVTFLDGAAIGALISASERTLQVGGSLQVTEHAACLRLLRLTGELERLSFQQSATEADIDPSAGASLDTGATSARPRGTSPAR